MRQDTKNNSGLSGLSGLLLGGIIGGVLGVLFAPQEGSKTRKQIKDKTDMKLQEAKTNLENASTDLRAKTDEAMVTVREKVDDARSDLANKVEDLQTKIDPAMDKVEETTENVRSKAKRKTEQLEEDLRN